MPSAISQAHTKSKFNLLTLAILLSFTSVLLTGRALATDRSTGGWGTTACPSGANIPTPAPISIGPSLTVNGADFSSGGVALRNRGTGVIHISGVQPPVSSAWLYWAVITNGAPPAAVTSLRIKRLAPTPASVRITVPGTNIGSGPAPCWPGTQITVFRGQIPLGVATGNGLYQVTLQAGAAGTTNGADPQVVIVNPLWDGASIVMIGAGTGLVSSFDNGLAGTTFTPSVPFAYTLALPIVVGRPAILESIGADGQHVIGTGFTSALQESDETTDINGTLIAGFGSPYLDSDWNGSAGLPMPELWDDTGHDITRAALGTSALNVTIFNSGGGATDCLTAVANVVRQ